MRIPKKLKLFGSTWKVVVVPDSGEGYGGGSFDWTKRTITLQKRYNEHEPAFFHEILEGILVHNNARFTGLEGSMEFQFNFDHTKFTRIAYDLFQVLQDNNMLK